MKVIYFGTTKYLVEQEENDRHGITAMNIVSADGDQYLVATKDIKETYWLLSNGQRFEDCDVCIREEI